LSDMCLNVLRLQAPTEPAPIPIVCPMEDCENPVPHRVTPAIRKAFEHHQELVDKYGADSNEVFRSSVMVHIEMEAERKSNTYFDLSRLNHWPIILDFKRLPDRIIAMQDELEALVMVHGARGNGPVQQGLRDSLARHGLGSDFTKLATISVHRVPEVIIHNARPG
jgi:hypothetical protein